MKPQDILQHLDRATLWPASPPGSGLADVAAAYRAALAVRALRSARGERPVGYKIGFTNRTIWQRYGVFAPIWGTVWHTTLLTCDDAGSVSLTGLSQPRLEPEIVFGIAATPPPAPSLAQMFDCVDWLAPGFEIVQSHHANWKFSAAEAVADGSLHARLLVGRRKPVRELAASGDALDALLAAASVQLRRDDTLVDQGRGANVLDGPLHALLHFVREMQQFPDAPSLQVGDVVTTGTWTDAWPIEPGQVWQAQFDPPLPGLALRCER